MQSRTKFLNMWIRSWRLNVQRRSMFLNLDILIHLFIPYLNQPVNLGVIKSVDVCWLHYETNYCCHLKLHLPCWSSLWQILVKHSRSKTDTECGLNTGTRSEKAIKPERLWTSWFPLDPTILVLWRASSRTHTGRLDYLSSSSTAFSVSPLSSTQSHSSLLLCLWKSVLCSLEQM